MHYNAYLFKRKFCIYRSIQSPYKMFFQTSPLCARIDNGIVPIIPLVRQKAKVPLCPFSNRVKSSFIKCLYSWDSVDNELGLDIRCISCSLRRVCSIFTIASSYILLVHLSLINITLIYSLYIFL